MDINEKVGVIGSALNDIKEAIAAKGVTPSGDITTYAEAIENIHDLIQEKTLVVNSTTPTETVVEPDSGYNGMSSVTFDMGYIENELDAILGEEEVPGRKYYKYVTEAYRTPNMTSNTDSGLTVASSFTQYNQVYHGGNETWYGFATAGGYTSPYFIGAYRDENVTTMNLFLTFGEDVTLPSITGFTFYTPAINSFSDWGSGKNGYLYGSENGSTWVLIYSHGALSSNTVQNFSFEATGYKYYKYSMVSSGTSHRDQVNVSSFHLTGTITSVVESTEDDYDFYVDPE